MLKGLIELSGFQTFMLIFAGMQMTLALISLYLHRGKTHLAVTLHPLVANTFRLWMWLTTLGVLTREWVAVHRKHHAKCDTVEDPHSPKFHGLSTLLLQGVVLYRKAIADKKMVEFYGKGVEAEWIGRKLCDKHKLLGAPVMLVTLVVLFGLSKGLLIWITQLAAMPLLAAAFINGVAHTFGYRNTETKDASRNMFPVGLLLCGEELHNNHHARASSAKFSEKWWEVDIGWGLIRLLAFFRLAKVNRV
jgi:stearoyl-CoA desaturase (delta-9 desaturase)